MTAMNGNSSVTVRCLAVDPRACHQDAHVGGFRDRRIDFAGDPALVDHQQAIRQRHHFFELGRHEQHRAAGIAQRHQLAMDELDRADVDAARRLRDEQQLRLRARTRGR